MEKAECSVADGGAAGAAESSTAAAAEQGKGRFQLGKMDTTTNTRAPIDASDDINMNIPHEKVKVKAKSRLGGSDSSGPSDGTGINQKSVASSKKAVGDTPAKKFTCVPRSSGLLTTQPTANDVLFGRGKPYQGHAGNIRLHRVVDLYKSRYSQARRHIKTEIAEEIVQFIKSGGADSKAGRFLKRAEGVDAWEEVSDTVARDKVSHALRGKARSTADPDRQEGLDSAKKALSMMVAKAKSPPPAENAPGETKKKKRTRPTSSSKPEHVIVPMKKRKHRKKKAGSSSRGNSPPSSISSKNDADQTKAASIDTDAVQHVAALPPADQRVPSLVNFNSEGIGSDTASLLWEQQQRQLQIQRMLLARSTGGINVESLLLGGGLQAGLNPLALQEQNLLLQRMQALSNPSFHPLLFNNMAIPNGVANINANGTTSRQPMDSSSAGAPGGGADDSNTSASKTEKTETGAATSTANNDDSSTPSQNERDQTALLQEERQRLIMETYIRQVQEREAAAASLLGRRGFFF